MSPRLQHAMRRAVLFGLWNGSALTRVFMRDGALYFLAILALHLLNAALSFQYGYLIVDTPFSAIHASQARSRNFRGRRPCRLPPSFGPGTQNMIAEPVLRDSQACRLCVERDRLAVLISSPTQGSPSAKRLVGGPTESTERSQTIPATSRRRPLPRKLQRRLWPSYNGPPGLRSRCMVRSELRRSWESQVTWTGTGRQARRYLGSCRRQQYDFDIA